MTTATPNHLRVLHAVRTLGYGDTARIARRVGLPHAEVEEHLRDAQARGWTVLTPPDDWSLSDAGKEAGERLLAAELDTAGARRQVTAGYDEFLAVNETVGAACTAWQLAEMGIGEAPVTLADTIATLREPARRLAGIERRLTEHLPRFAGYHRRFVTALDRAGAAPAWITGIDRDSCHLVWFELHEDLLATLGRTR
jgi:hypothetical protein